MTTRPYNISPLRWLSNLSRTLLASCGLLPVLPLFIVSIGLSGPSFHWLRGSDLEVATLNSLFAGALSSTLSLGLALVLCGGRAGHPQARFLILLLIFVPGDLVSHGYNYLHATYWNLTGSAALRSPVFILSLAGYVLPYQCLIILFKYAEIGSSELRSARELMTAGSHVRYLLERLRSAIVAAWLIGLFIGATEVPRSHILGADFFGQGKTYLGPFFVQQFASGGFAQIYFLFCALMYFLAVSSVSLPAVPRRQFVPPFRAITARSPRGARD